MIVSKSNLQAISVLKNDKGIPVLNNLRIERDGSTVAVGGKCVVVVSPVRKEVRENVPLEETEISDGITVNRETVESVIKNIPKDTMFKGVLEHADVNDKGAFIITDGKRHKKISGKLYDREYVNWKSVFENGENGMRIVLNRKRLLLLLDTLDKICIDTSGESPVYIEFTDKGDVLLKAINMVNGQRAMALMKTYKSEEGQWLKSDEWERSLKNGKSKRRFRKKGES